MSLRFEPCPCQLHGRFLGDRGLPVEVASREMASSMLNDAERNGVLGPGDRARILSAISATMMVVKEDWIDDALRQRVMLWNLAAAATNDSAAFSTTDFHAYQALVDDFGQDDPAA